MVDFSDIDTPEEVEELIKKTKAQLTKELAKDKIFLSGLALVIIGLEPFVQGLQAVLPAGYAQPVGVVLAALIVVAKVWQKFFPAKDEAGNVIEPPTPSDTEVK